MTPHGKRWRRRFGHRQNSHCESRGEGICSSDLRRLARSLMLRGIALQSYQPSSKKGNVENLCADGLFMCKAKRERLSSQCQMAGGGIRPQSFIPSSGSKFPPLARVSQHAPSYDGHMSRVSLRRMLVICESYRRVANATVGAGIDAKPGVNADVILTPPKTPSRCLSDAHPTTSSWRQTGIASPPRWTSTGDVHWTSTVTSTVTSN